MFKRIAKTAVATVCGRPGRAEIVRRWTGRPSGPLVVGYHRVEERFRSPDPNGIPPMAISRGMLERHLDHIGRCYDFVSLDELSDPHRCSRIARRGRAPVAVTFDDGYGSVYENAFPMLTRLGIPAAVFVVSRVTGTSNIMLHDALYLLLDHAFRAGETLESVLLEAGVPMEIDKRVGPTAWAAMSLLLDRLPQDDIRRLVALLGSRFLIDPAVRTALRPLSWSEIREMDRAGITIGSHTSTHALLTNERWDRVLAETRESREQLERGLGKRVHHFAFPDGRFDSAAVSAVAAAGYKYAYTTCLHRDARRPHLTIPRQMLWERSSLDCFDRFSGAILTCQLHGLFDLASRCERKHQSFSRPVTASATPVREEVS